ncbi:MAG: hypothetical protein NDP13_03810 [Crenarchaeota archaeon]|nr:hypothetical protein [Thermoproteota archaeon]MCR8455415.1 hypothetical protein [Thermoproteota archaeon]
MSGYVESIKNLLKYAKISEDAMIVYTALIGLRPRSLGDISNLTGLDPLTLEKALKELIVAKLAREFPGNPPMYEALPPYSLIKLQIDELTTAVTEFEKGLTADVRESTNAISESIKEMINNMSKSLENLVISIASAIETSLMNVLYESVLKTLESVFNKVLEDFKTIVSKELHTLKSSTVSNLGSSIGTYSRDLATHMELLAQELATKTRELLEKRVKQKIEEILDLFNLTKASIDALIIKGFEKEFRPEYDVRIAKGLDIIKGHVGDLIKRAENFIVLAAPTYDYVPVELIQKISPKVRIQIVAEAFPAHQRIIEELKSRGPTVQLRTMKNVRVFGVVMDLKEAVLAAIPETIVDPHSIIGIVTNDETWVAFIQSELLHLFAGASKV